MSCRITLQLRMSPDQDPGAAAHDKDDFGFDFAIFDRPGLRGRTPASLQACVQATDGFGVERAKQRDVRQRSRGPSNTVASCQHPRQLPRIPKPE